MNANTYENQLISNKDIKKQKGNVYSVHSVHYIVKIVYRLFCVKSTNIGKHPR